MGQELLDRTGDVDHGVIPGGRDNVPIDESQAQIATESVVESQCIVDLVPVLVAQHGEVARLCGLVQELATTSRFGVDERFVNPLKGRQPLAARAVPKGQPGRHPRQGKRDD